MKTYIHQICPRCHGLGRTTMINPIIRQEVQQVRTWVCANIRRGSIILLGKHYRKVLSVTRPTGTLVLRKVNSGGRFPTNSTTTITVYDYRHKLKGVRI